MSTDVFTFRPIDAWPGEFTRNRQRSRFDSTYSQTLDLLKRELRQLGARNVVLQIAITGQDLRRDGLMRANSQPSHPGVILSFESKFGPQSYPCDKFTNWQHNLRAIALTLEHLRAVDRYGVSKRGEQYRGWDALPPPREETTIEKAAAWIRARAGGTVERILSSREELKAAYNRYSQVVHPDKPNGNNAEFLELKRNYDLIREAKGWER